MFRGSSKPLKTFSRDLPPKAFGRTPILRSYVSFSYDITPGGLVGIPFFILVLRAAKKKARQLIPKTRPQRKNNPTARPTTKSKSHARSLSDSPCEALALDPSS